MAFTIWDIKIMRWRLNRSAITPENREINGLGKVVEHQDQAELKIRVCDLEDKPTENQQLHPPGKLVEGAHVPDSTKGAVFQYCQ